MPAINWPEIGRAAVFVGVSQLAGVVGTVFTVPAIPAWYEQLRKPPSRPPNWVFGPVWTTLYTMMGVAAYLVWRKGGRRAEVRRALGLFGGQLALNTLWSIVFFGLRSPLAGLATIAALWATIIATIRSFTPISRPAAQLLTPYLGWVSFAAVLNAQIAQLNPEEGWGRIARRRG